MKFRVAVVGKEGAGKSTVINNYCGFKDDDPHAAQVGVMKTCNVLMEYVSPENPEVIMTEIPHGVPIENKYDAFVIVSNSKILVVDHKYIETVKEFNKPFFFLKSHVDMDFQNAARRNISQNATKKTILDDCMKIDELIYLETLFLVGYKDGNSTDLGLDYESFVKHLNSLQ